MSLSGIVFPRTGSSQARGIRKATAATLAAKGREYEAAAGNAIGHGLAGEAPDPRGTKKAPTPAILSAMRRPWLALAAVALAAAPLRADFLRGDASFDGKLNLLDAVAEIQALFRDRELACLDAADTNDDGRLGVDDAVLVLEALFRGRELPGPGPLAAGPDATCDSLGCQAAPGPTPAVVLSEIDYNPAAPGDESIELHNRAAAAIPLAGCRLTGGIDFTFPDDAIIPAGGFVLVLKNPTHLRWRRLEVP